MSAYGNWQPVIGLEIHAQLSTASKLFSGASTAYGAEPNTHTGLVDIALPGTLPVPNRAACLRQLAATCLGCMWCGGWPISTRWRRR